MKKKVELKLALMISVLLLVDLSGCIDTVEEEEDGSKDSVFKSRTGTWKYIGLKEDTHCVQSIAVNPDNTDILIAGTYNGMYRSADQGVTWNLVYGGDNSDCHGIIPDPENNNVLYALADGVIVRSLDGGVNWGKMGRPSEDHYCISFSIDPNDPSTIYAGWYKEDAGEESGMFKSVSSGTSWSHISEGLIHYADYVVQGDKWRVVDIRTITVDPNDSTNIYMGASNGVRKNFDGGDTWPINASGGPYVNVILVDPNDSKTIYSGAWGLKKSPDKGESWELIALGGSIVMDLLIDPNDDDIMYAGTYEWGVHRSIDDGKSWEEIWRVYDPPLETNEIHDLAYDLGDPLTLYAATKKGVYSITFE